jgi:sugar transferase (PEP-CTERM system associated)
MPTLAEQIIPRRKLMLMASEAAIFTGILFAGTSLWPLANVPVDLLHPDSRMLRGLLTCFTIALICQTSLSYNELYDWKISQNRAELPNRLLHSCGYALVMLALLVLIAPALFFFPGLPNIGSDTWKLILLLAFAFLLVFLFRVAFHWFFYKWRWGERVLVLGDDAAAQELARMVADNPLAGFELVGLVTPQEAPPGHDGHDRPVWQRTVGAVDRLLPLANAHGVARVVVCLQERRGKVPIEQLLACRMAGIEVEEREAMYERIAGKLALESMRPSYLIYSRGFMKDPMTLALKRVGDILFALTGLVLSLPICLLAILLVKLTSRGPVFFTQERSGQDGAAFRLLKFRTMRDGAEQATGPVWASANDSRITPVGRLLRMTRIDEIPQFVNILLGQMSFVGPRPERPHFVEQLSKQIPFYPLRHTVKPGLTGWAQVRHPYGASVDDAQEKLRFDLYYIKNMGLMFDLNIVLRTIGVILLGKGAR